MVLVWWGGGPVWGSAVSDSVFTWTDHFAGESLDMDIWSFVDPRGDAGVALDASVVLLDVAAGVDHDPWKVNTAVRIMRGVADADFRIEAKFDSVVEQRFQMQGLLVEQDGGNYVRFDTYSDGRVVRIFAASFSNGKASVKVNRSLAGGTAAYLAIQREGSVWTCWYSYDSESWYVAGMFSRVLAAQSVGLFGGNASDSGTKGPAFTCAADYFVLECEAMGPGVPAEYGLAVDVVGSGEVVREPEAATYLEGEVVELTAFEEPGWEFVGWSGDVTGSDNPIVLTVTGDHSVTATFEPIVVSHTLDMVIVGSGEVVREPEAATYSEGEVVELTAFEEPGWEFVGWSGDVTGSDNPIVLTVTGDHSVTATFEVVEPGDGVLRDDFDGAELDGGVWMFVDPRGDSSVGVAESAAFISVAAGLDHDAWTANTAPRVLRAVGDFDFEVEAKFDSVVAERFQMQGLLVEGEAGDYLRFDVYCDGSMVRIFGASFRGGIASVKVNSILYGGSPGYLKVQREGHEWTYSYSYDGVTWLVAGSFSCILEVESSGFFAGNASDNGVSGPAFVCAVDYFSLRSDAFLPPVTEYPVTIEVVGNGDVTRSPDLEVYRAGEAVSLRAHGEPGWYFLGWAGDLSGNDNPAVLTVEGASFVRAVFVQADSEQSLIDVWYGQRQSFGGVGIAQRWVNILGNITDVAVLESLTYSLNGQAERPLSVGPTESLRLAAAGDFNVEIDCASLLNGTNTVELRATTSGGLVSQLVTVDYAAGNVWPLPYEIDWAGVEAVTDVSHVVDGLWEHSSEGVRPVEVGYDRLLAIGDVEWEDYEVTVPVRIDGVDIYAGQAGGEPAVGLLVRWPGHIAWTASDQPRIGWYPMGALGWFYWGNSVASGAYQIVASTGRIGVTDASGLVPQLGVEYIWKMRARTVAGEGSLYELKVWERGVAEPSSWLLTWQSEAWAPTRGSLLLLAHHCDVTFGNVEVVPASW